jgi:hypothetical protein
MRPWRLVVDEVWREEEKVKYVRKINKEKKKNRRILSIFYCFQPPRKVTSLLARAACILSATTGVETSSQK